MSMPHIPIPAQSAPKQATSERRSFAIYRIKYAMAGLCLAGALLCLWTASGMPFPFSGPSVASAGISPGATDAPILSSETTELKKMLLQASVDSAALGISGILENISAAEEKRTALARALDSLTFDLGAPVYFTAWEGTRLIHSPLTPDIEGMDFADALDSRGVAFMRAQTEHVKKGGGFIQVILPRHNFDTASPHIKNSSVAKGTAVTSPECISLAGPSLYSSTASAFLEEVEEVQIIYTRPIPNSSWHISAFMTLPDTDGGVHGTMPQASTPMHIWESSLLKDKDAAMHADFTLRKGLYVSGLSLLGFAGILVTPRRRQ